MLTGVQNGCLVSVEGQPLIQVQQFLQDYSKGVRVSELSASVEGSLVSSLLTALPVEPHQFAGEYDLRPNSRRLRSLCRTISSVEPFVSTR